MSKKAEQERPWWDVDAANLPEEWLRQPGLRRSYGLKLADARWDMAEAKSMMELVEAELDHEFRTDPTGLGVERVTETVIAYAVRRHKEYRQAQQEYNNARRRVDRLEAEIAALEHRKKLLECEVTMQVGGFHAEPRPPKGAGYEEARAIQRDAAFSRPKVKPRS